MADLRQHAEQLRAVLRDKPDDFAALHELGVIQHLLGDNVGAIDFLTRAAASPAASSSVHYNLGLILAKTGQADRAIESFQRALSLKPADTDALNALGNALRTLGRLGDACDVYQRAIALRPEHALIHSNLGMTLQRQGRLDEAIASFRAALRLNPADAAARSNLLLSLNYSDQHKAAEIFVEHQAFAQIHERDVAPPVRQQPSADGRVRIGYLSPDFRRHSVAFFIWPVLERYDRSKFAVTCYSDVADPDPVTSVLRGFAESWRDVAGWSDDGLAARIRADRIDILIDLAGHTAGNRMRMLAQRVAPVQATYLGYPNTTGLAAMDWRITDAIADPPGQTESLHSERLMRVPGCSWCYGLAAEAPPVAPPPALRDGRLTFGSFNNFAKVSPTTLGLWSTTLAATPGSRLILKSPGLDDLPTQRHVVEKLAAAGIDPARVELLGRIESFADHLRVYDRIDIALDTYPYHGTTTTCEALRMGVPVVTLAGKTHVSRVGVSLLTAAGCPEWIARDEEHYADIAARLARDISHLADLRKTLRQRFESSPLCDATGFVRRFESVLTQLPQNVP